MNHVEYQEIMKGGTLTPEELQAFEQFVREQERIQIKREQARLEEEIENGTK